MPMSSALTEAGISVSGHTLTAIAMRFFNLNNLLQIMAKVYEPDIDPDEFIRSFREDTSQLSQLKRSSKPETTTAPISDTVSPNDSGSPPTLDREKEYIENFVSNMAFMSPTEKFTTVEICPAFIKKIKYILLAQDGRKCSLKAYINNVLAEHFKQYEDVIKKRL